MLLEFKFQNFRSFFNQSVLSMIASSQREHSEFIIKTKNNRVLPSAIIYGANASGKTSVILALSLLREMIITGNIRQTKDNQLLGLIELLPFIHNYQRLNMPIKLEITFLSGDIEFNYKIEFESNIKSNNFFKRRIVFEQLTCDENEIFTRSKDRISLESNKKALNYYKEINKVGVLNVLEKQINNNLDETDLFISNGFKSVVNSDLAQKVIAWFSTQLLTITDFDRTEFEIEIPDNAPEGEIRLQNSIMSALLRHADFGPQDVSYVIDNKDNSKQKQALRSNYKVEGMPGNEGIEVLSSITESKGTLKILKFAFPLINALENGSVLVIDELDSSMHPDLIAGIIKVFNNPEINTKGAQLIFNTHNPIYLNKNLFRRDQIIFVSKDKETYESEIYSLADFKTSGPKSVRDDERFMKNYINGKYGALPFVDLEGTIKQSLELMDMHAPITVNVFVE